MQNAGALNPQEIIHQTLIRIIIGTAALSIYILWCSKLEYELENTVPAPDLIKLTYWYTDSLTNAKEMSPSITTLAYTKQCPLKRASQTSNGKVNRKLTSSLGEME